MEEICYCGNPIELHNMKELSICIADFIEDCETR